MRFPPFASGSGTRKRGRQETMLKSGKTTAETLAKVLSAK